MGTKHLWSRISREIKEVFCLEVTLFCHVSRQKLIQISKYCFLIGWHSNLDQFLQADMKKGDFLEIDMRLQKDFDPIIQEPQKLHWSTTCGPSCICHTVWEYFVWPICFVGCHWFAILCILLILLGRLYLGVTLPPPQDQKKDVCMIRVFNLVAGVCITIGQKVLLWICIFSFLHKYLKILPYFLYLFISKIDYLGI